MSMVEQWWRIPGAKLGTALVVVLLVLAVPVWSSWLSWLVIRESLGLLSFLGNALGLPLTVLVVFVGMVALIGDVPGHHKAVIVGIMVLTVAARLTFMMFF